MKKASFIDVSNHVKQYFDIVEAGESVRVLRNGKPIADIVPVLPKPPSWKRKQAQPLLLEGTTASNMIMEARSSGM